MKQTNFRHMFEMLTNVPIDTFGILFDLLKRIVHHQTGDKFTKDLGDWLAGRKELVETKNVLINWLGITTIDATTEKFVAKNRFRKDSKEVELYGFYGSFKEDFLAGEGKIEEPQGEKELRRGQLLKPAKDILKNTGNTAIILKLGGEAKVETTLTDMFCQLKKQPNGEKNGDLNIGSCANVFYIRNRHGVLRTVRALCTDGWDVYWGDPGWRLHSEDLDQPFDFGVGPFVFCNDFYA